MEFTTEIGVMDFGVSGDNGWRRNKKGAFRTASLHPLGLLEAVPKTNSLSSLAHLPNYSRTLPLR